MACNFTWVSSSIFRNNLASLRKDYPSCELDICEEFKDMSLQDVFAKNYVLSDSGKARVIKVRIANSHSKKGKSGGFRAIIIANLEREHVCLAALFVKTGSKGIDNIERSELKEVIKCYQSEYKNNDLIEHCRNANLVNIDFA